ncbi:hypothetical protein AB1Y20_018656 [Prymnesium parvum]|uniref:Cilia- and flagella-associated protein 157 n=1 Tax=Prymnesium parvum TaxID=97485 RepID=A0AB34JSW8_PRYPA
MSVARSVLEAQDRLERQLIELESFRHELSVLYTQKDAELRASQDNLSQLHEHALSLSNDFSSATRQIGKLEERLADQAHKLREGEVVQSSLQKELALVEAKYSELQSTLRRVESERNKEAERDKILYRSVAEAERRCKECTERERQMRVVLERHAREGALAAAAVQSFKDDAEARLEENVQLRLLCQRLGATPVELQRARKSRGTRETALEPASSQARQVAPKATMSVASTTTRESDIRMGRPWLRNELVDKDHEDCVTSNTLGDISGAKLEPLSSYANLQERLNNIRAKFAEAF